MAVGDILEEQFNLFRWDNVANGIRTTEAIEGQTNHFITDDCWPATAGGADGGINLNAQAIHRSAVRGELDPRHDALGSRKVVAAFRKTVRQDCILYFGQGFGARQRWMQIKELFVVELEPREVNAGSDRLDRGGNPVPSLAGLDLHLIGVK